MKSDEYKKMFNEFEKRNNSENKVDIIYTYMLSEIVENIEELNKIENIILFNNTQILGIK